MNTYKLKTSNPNCREIKIEAVNILEALNSAMALYHGLIEEEITEIKKVINF